MDDRRGERDLQRLKWIGVILPVAFVWLFEALRLAYLDKAYGEETGHLLSALLLGVAVIVFALVMSHFIDRTQRRIVGHNKDLTLTHAVTSAVRGGLGMEETLGAALDRMLDQTSALAGAIRIPGPDGDVLPIQRPVSLAAGLEWVAPLLGEAPASPLLEPTYSTRSALDTLLLDLPLTRGSRTLGTLRLVFHPPVRPEVSTSALVDVAGETATSVEINRLVADLRRRERELAALNEVAIQLTGGGDVRLVLETINRHARELLSADRSIVCLADPRDARAMADGTADRLALVDDGAVCAFSHTGGPGDHARNPACPLAGRVPDTEWISRPLRSPDGSLGELCVVREHGGGFRSSEQTLLAALADLAAVAVRTARLRDAEQQWTILAERDRIARELHDSMAQVLGVIHLKLRSLESAATARPAALAPDLTELADMADEAYRDVREAILGLRETIPSDGGLEGALREYLRKFTRQTGIQATLLCEGDVRSMLPPRSEVQLLRVVQEALTNVRKHSGARRATVTLDCTTHPPRLVIEDDGGGFEPSRVAASFDGGFGLASMRERVEGIGGALDVHTAPGQGTRIVVRLEAEGPGVAPTTAVAGAARR
ncbi:MAG TPA: sensor histidine kinase [Candidatus Dormibacteraeota bacterium]|nr:sensor histidine kinase [Candidatus Dormibacteraeota bacterium]